MGEYFLKIRCRSASTDHAPVLAGMLFYGGDAPCEIMMSGELDGQEIPLLMITMPPDVAHRWEEPGQTIALHKLAAPPPAPNEETQDNG